MRAFFGLALDPEVCRLIDEWRRVSYPPFGRPVPVENLHITLVFLGELDASRLRELERSVRDICMLPFNLRFGSTGYWPKQEIVYLSPLSVPTELTDLVASLRSVARRSGIRVEKRRYLPHVTLARRCAAPPPPPVQPLDVELEFRDFVLFESVRVAGHISYREVWRL